LRLNLGCGEKLLPAKEGWLNIDLNRPEHVNGHAFLSHDLREPLPIASGSVSHIYASHIIEHFTVGEWQSVKEDWHRALMDGGTLILECPDVIRCATFFANDMGGRRWDLWHTTLYGEAPEIDEETGMGDGRFGRHKQGFDIPRLSRELKGLGLTVTRARPWNPEGAFVSFNIRVEAVKGEG